MSDEEMPANYAQRVGERLRAVRKQKRLSLQAVEASSGQEFKASVLGAYERGERSISVPRLQRLATFYAVPVDQLIRIEMPPAKVDDDHIHARVVQIDHFGNLQLNFGRSELEGIGVILGDETEVRVGGRSFRAPYSQAFSEVKKGGLILLEDSHRHLTIAVNMVIVARVQIAGN